MTLKRRLRQTAVTLVALVALSVASAGALVTPQRELPGTKETPEQPAASLVSGDFRSEGGIQSHAVEYSPAGCVGKSNNPHETVYGYIKGVTQVDCDAFVSELRTTAQLWRLRWWGYEKVGTKGDNTNQWDDQVKASAKYDWCESNRWRTTGDHWSVERGKTYTAHTWRYADVGCR